MEKLSSTQKGLVCQRQVTAFLRRYKFSVHEQQFHSPFDLLVNNKRIEVKAAGFDTTKKFWLFNIHRHNVLDETNVDIYILRLENVPGFTYAIHLIIPAPLGVFNVQISLRSLLTRWGKYFNNIDALR